MLIKYHQSVNPVSFLSFIALSRSNFGPSLSDYVKVI